MQHPYGFKQLLFCEIGEPSLSATVLIGPVSGTADSKFLFELRLYFTSDHS